MIIKTTARIFADQFDMNGMRFTANDGAEFSEVAARFNATIEYSQRDGIDEETGRQKYRRGYQGSAFCGDPIRYIFPDRSVIVTAGDGWDFEGAEPFSWKNE